MNKGNDYTVSLRRKERIKVRFEEMIKKYIKRKARVVALFQVLFPAILLALYSLSFSAIELVKFSPFGLLTTQPIIFLAHSCVHSATKSMPRKAFRRSLK